MAKHVTATLALLGMSAAAGATPVNVTETISLSQLLSGNSTSLSFNVGSQLSTLGLNAGDIRSAELVVYGYSDAQYAAPEAGPYSGYEVTGYTGHAVYSPMYYSYWVNTGCYYSWWDGTSCYGYTAYGTYYVQSGYVTDAYTVRSRDIDHTDAVADTMLVSAGDSSASGIATTHTSSVGQYGGSTYTGTDGDYYNGYLYRYNRERDVYDAIAGDITTSLQLDAAALADLTADGIVSSTVSATAGSFHLTSASLNLVAEATASGNVPEPGSLALVALAGLGAAVAGRRKKK